MAQQHHFRVLVFNIVVTLLSVQAANGQPPATIDEQPPPSADSNAAAGGFLIDVQQIRTQSRTSLESLHGQVEIRLKVSNRGQTPKPLSNSQWEFKCNAHSSVLNTAIQDPLTDSERVLQPGESCEGWLAFVVQHTSTTEPLMSLTWKDDGASRTIDINAAMRKTSALQLSFLGPENCLAVVQLERAMDQIAVWLLTEEFQVIRKKGVERVVLDLRPGDKKGPPTYTLRRALETWLMSVQRGGEIYRFPFRSHVKSPVQFDHFYVSNRRSYVLNTGSAGVYRQTVNIFRKDREHAVADALRSVYERAMVNDALKDLQHPEPGIRRAVIESNIDRLTEEQLRSLLERTAVRPPTHQAMVAENLYRVSLSTGTETLAEMVRSPDAEVSQAALKSLVMSVSAKAAGTLKKLWRERAESQAARLDIVNAIMEAKDHRHLDLLIEFAEQFVADFSERNRDLSRGSGDSAGGKTGSSSKAEVSSDKNASSRQPNVIASHTKVLQDVLKFLRDQGEDGFAATARQKLMKITNPVVQDVVMNHILTNSSATDEGLVRRYIGQRLPPVSASDDLTDEQRAKLVRRFGVRSSQGSTRISETLIKTIRKYPSSGYTDRLVDLSKSPAVSTSLRPQVFQVAVRCATDEQLSNIIAGFQSLDISAKQYLLNQLATMQHPEWLPLAKQCLRADDSMLNIALASLRSNGSPEATQAIVDVLNELHTQVENAGLDRPKAGDQQKKESPAPGIPAPEVPLRKRSFVAPVKQINADNRLKRILPILATSTYPEARRAINRCNRSGRKTVSDFAFQAIIRFHQANPNRAEVSKAYELRKAKDYDAALQVYNRILQTDPFYSSGYVSRASLRLRAGHPEPAMEDLKVARKLDPENPLIESLFALTEIRLGNVEKGIQQSEKILRSIPDLETMVRRDTVYNTACAYGRAAEVAKSESRRDAYLKRGIEMLWDSVKRKPGFDDVNHALNDPDLNAFHDHPEWDNLITQIGENEKKKKQR